MRITFLGTGTSAGVPVIACDCAVCTSDDPRDRRRRASLYVEASGSHLLIDTPPDFREQALAYDLRRVDAVLFTHSHADHIFGFDDIRRFNTIQDDVIPAYAVAETLGDLRRVFNYVGLERVPGFYRPRIDFREISGPFHVGSVAVHPLHVEHGSKATIGFKIEAEGRSLAYVPDCFTMSDETLEHVRGVDVMVLDALKRTPHKTHLKLEDSIHLLEQIAARQSFIIHMSHDLLHVATQALLPDGMAVSYDGLVLEW